MKRQIVATCAVGVGLLGFVPGVHAQCGIETTEAYPGPHTDTIELRLKAKQNDFESGTDPYAAYGVHNHAIVVGGWAMYAEGTETPELFVSRTSGQVGTRLATWISSRETSHAWFDADTYSGFVILDIEHPLHPQDFHTWFVDDDDPATNYVVDGSNQPIYVDVNDDPILLDHMIDAFNMRIAVARSYFPQAQLVLYGHFSPIPRATVRLRHAVTTRLAGLKSGERGPLVFGLRPPFDPSGRFALPCRRCGGGLSLARSCGGQSDRVAVQTQSDPLPEEYVVPCSTPARRTADDAYWPELSCVMNAIRGSPHAAFTLPESIGEPE